MVEAEEGYYELKVEWNNAVVPYFSCIKGKVTQAGLNIGTQMEP